MSFPLRLKSLYSFQDGRIDYNEFVAMMQDGLGKGLQKSMSIGFREAFKQ